MGLRPIDLQIMLKQMTEVGRIENNRQNKKKLDDMSRDKASVQKFQNQAESIVEADKVEIDGNIIHDDQKKDRRRRKGQKEEKDEERKKKKAKIDEEFKGNFLDVME